MKKDKEEISSETDSLSRSSKRSSQKNESQRSILDDSTSELESENDLCQSQNSVKKSHPIWSDRRSKVIKILKDWDLDSMEMMTVLKNFLKGWRTVKRAQASLIRTFYKHYRSSSKRMRVGLGRCDVR